MTAKFGFWLVLLTLLFGFVVAAPGTAYAQEDASVHLCDDGSIDKTFIINRTAHQQGELKSALAVVNLFPVVSAWNTCVTNIMNVFKSVPDFADPSKITSAIMGPLVANLISGVCSQVMSAITSAQQGLAQMAQICLPIPSFMPSLDLNLGLNGASCSGGTTVNLITGFTPQQNYPTNSSGFMGH